MHYFFTSAALGEALHFTKNPFHSPKAVPHQQNRKNGGLENRTPDLVHAKHALYQLS